MFRKSLFQPIPPEEPPVVETADGEEPETPETEENPALLFPSRLLAKTVVSLLSLLILMFICGRDSGSGWLAWIRGHFHNAIHATSADTFGYISDSAMFRSLVAGSRNLIQLDDLSTRLSTQKPYYPDMEIFENAVWPVEGKVTKKFGWQTIPGTTTRQYSRGIEITAQPGAVVYAPAAGEIVRIISVPRQGWTVVLDHGNEWNSVFNRLAVLDVKAGQTINTGEALARLGVGDTENGAILGWEITRENQPVDPSLLISL